ncbi:MAG: beta-glucosidase BglX [Limisphaerales bacterium]
MPPNKLLFATGASIKYAVFILGLFYCLAASAAGSMYHDGWIDLDKNETKDIYEDPSMPVAKRVDDLLARMTLEEKIGQLWQDQIETNSDVTLADKLKRGEIGSFLDPASLIVSPGLRNKTQRIAVEQSRLGIPLIFGNDVIHGFRTIFPIPLAQACAWEPDLFQRTDTIAAREAAAAGIDWAFAPMVDLARDPRWGRIAEGFGEDPWLGALDAAACVRGFQGTNVAGTNRVVACLKHYIGYGAAEGGRDYNTTEISEYTLRNFYLPQFKAGVDAGALTVMSAFNCLSGFPASANRHALTDILRGELKFPGFVVSDWNAVTELIDHGVAANEAEAAKLALTAGVDMEMLSTTYSDTLAKQIQAGKIPQSVLDEAVRRVLTVKFEKGLFDHPFTDEARCKAAFLRPDALALAREVAAKSCVLLKNENETLPLSRSVKKIALIGPLADEPGEMFGCWAPHKQANDVISLATGIRAKLAPEAELTVTQGCDLTGTGKIQKRLDGTTAVAADTEKAGEDGFAKAVAAANNADVVILALGEPSGWCGENSSRSHLGLPGRQQELFDAVVATGKPVIVVLFNGRPLALPRVQEKAAAILEAWFPGVQGGNGVADVLFGDVDPGGRLTTTFPNSVGQVPIYYNHFNTGRPDLGKYLDGPSTPLYPFGFGLAYTTFEYGKVRLSTRELKPGKTLVASVNIKNTGACAGTEVVQLYIRDMAASAGPRPVRELKGFQKVLLQPGESRKLSFSISEKKLGYYDAKGNWLVEPGEFQLWLSKDSASGMPVKFELTK